MPAPRQFRLTLRSFLEDACIGAGIVAVVTSIVLAYHDQHVQPLGAMAGGSGTAADPYRVGTCRQLQSIKDVVDASYVLVRDVDCRGSYAWNNAEGFFPLGYYDRGFGGTFDGAGHVISRLTMRRRNMDDVGFFGKLKAGAVVKNVRLDFADIEGRDDVGVIAGWVAADARIENVSVAGELRGRNRVGAVAGVQEGVVSGAKADVTVLGSGDGIGGIAGWNYSNGHIEGSTASGSVQGRDFVGGVVGINYCASVAGVRGLSDTDGRQLVGGLIGYLAGTSRIPSVISDSAAAGAVTGVRGTGGLIGQKDGEVVLKGCFRLMRR